VDSVHTDIIFGYFGKAINITDGKHVYFRNPTRADAGPLFEYTAMPTWFHRNRADQLRVSKRKVFSKVETGRYFSHTYNLPLYKIPVSGFPPVDNTGKFLVGVNQLFDLKQDPDQEKSIEDPSKEQQFAERIRYHLKLCEAQPEQYERLGLEPVPPESKL